MNVDVIAITIMLKFVPEELLKLAIAILQSCPTTIAATVSFVVTKPRRSVIRSTAIRIK